MTSRIAGAGLLLALCCGWWLAMPAAAPLASAPQNFQVSGLTPGPGRFQVSLVYEWDAPMGSAATGTYQLNSHCAFTAKQPLKFSGNSGLTIISGQGPHYKLDAVCNCERYKYIGPAVRAYAPYSAWVMLANLPGPALANKPGWFEAPCKQTK